MKDIQAYNVAGYVCLFCPDCIDNGRCSSVDGDGGDYHVSKHDKVVANMLCRRQSVPLLIHHFSDAVVGYVAGFAADHKGVYAVGAVIDNLEFLDYMRDIYEHTYSHIYAGSSHCGFEAVLKKQLTGFSLSHALETGEVAHVGLVCHPARFGTLVQYSINTTAVPRYYNNISTVIKRLTGQVMVFHGHNHKKYLIDSLRKSRHADDTTFLNASASPPPSSSLTMSTSFEDIQKLMTLLQGVIDNKNDATTTDSGGDETTKEQTPPAETPTAAADAPAPAAAAEAESGPSSAKQPREQSMSDDIIEKMTTANKSMLDDVYAKIGNLTDVLADDRQSRNTDSQQLRALIDQLTKASTAQQTQINRLQQQPPPAASLHHKKPCSAAVPSASSSRQPTMIEASAPPQASAHTNLESVDFDVLKKTLTNLIVDQVCNNNST